MAMISGKIPLGAVVTGTVSKAQSVVKTELVFSTRAEFPKSGNSQYLYIAQDENVCYRFDKETGEYVSLGGNNSGESVEVDLSDYYKKDETDALLDKKLSEERVSAVALSGDYNDLENAPSELPASDVHEWAKAESKPEYTAEEVGADTKGAAENALETAKTYADGKADEILQSLQPLTTEVLTLTAADWVDNSQTVECAIDTSKRNVIDVLTESIAAWTSAGVLGISETETGLTFQCSSVPTADLYFRITSMEVN